MRNSLYWASAAVMIVIAIAMYLFTSKSEENPLVLKTIRYGFTVKNETSSLISEAKFKVFSPTQASGRQVLLSLSSTHSYQVVDGGGGNQEMEFTLIDFAPYSSKIISITAEVGFYKRPVSEPSVVAEGFILSEKYADLGSPVVKKTSRQFEGDVDISRSIYNWLIDNVEYTGFVSKNLGASYAIENGAGDCTEFMYAFMALARSHKIPTRGVGGFVVSKDSSILASSDFHNWAEVFESGRWLIIDAQKEFFKSGEPDYVSFRIFDSVSSHHSTNKFSFFDNRMSVRMN